MMHEWWTGWGPGAWGGMWFGPWLMLLLLVLVAVCLIAAVRGVYGRSEPAGGRSTTAREILDQRFAKGEIDKNEYEERRKALGA